MLSVKHYPQEYVDSCRARFERQLDAYDDASVTDAFRTEFFNNLVLALEQSFVHRMRGNEGKGGNPLNEVRMLASSILGNDAVLAPDKSIKYDPARSVLGLEIGAPIDLGPEEFQKLVGGFFETIEERFPPAD